jgi:EF hand
LPPETLNSRLQMKGRGAILGARFASDVARPEHMTGREIKMISRLFILLATAAILAAGNLGAQAASKTPNPVKMFDTDNDGTLDLGEAKKAGTALFAKLDRDHDGTLDRRELSARLSAKEFQAADPDHDGTLTLDEYLAAVEQRFAAADPDKDGTLDAKELNSRAGRALLRLLH